jgi:hypothetical protein
MLNLGAARPDVGGVGATQSRRRALRADVQDLLVRGGAAFGLIPGLWWGLNHPAQAAAASCKAPAADRIGDCVGDTLFAAVLPYALAMTGGMAVGAIVGWLMAKLLLGPNHVGRRRSAMPAPRARVAAPAGVASGRWITARYDGICRACGAPIRAGDHVRHRPRHTVCGRCG